MIRKRVNLSGAFFNSNAPVGSFYINDDYSTPVPLPYQGGTAGAQALVLLHEIAHAIDPTQIQGQGAWTQNDSGNTAAEAENNTLVMQNCIGVISRAEGIF